MVEFPITSQQLSVLVCFETSSRVYSFNSAMAKFYVTPMCFVQCQQAMQKCDEAEAALVVCTRDDETKQTQTEGKRHITRLQQGHFELCASSAHPTVRLTTSPFFSNTRWAAHVLSKFCVPDRHTSTRRRGRPVILHRTTLLVF